jgi:hypothetical protein
MPDGRVIVDNTRGIPVGEFLSEPVEHWVT